MDRLSRARRLVPHQRELGEPHARRRHLHLRGPAAELRGPARARRARACTWCRASARSSPTRRPRPGGRSGSTTRPSTSSTTCATRRCPRRARRSSCATWPPASSRQQLDRTKPLWELWMVQGLTRKRFAFVTKTHHALVDGVSGVDIATVLFDVKPVPEPAEPDHDWVAEPDAVGRPAARQGRRGPRRARRSRAAAPARARGRAPAGDRCTRSPRRPRRSARSAGTSPTRRPTVPLNVAGRLAPPLRVGARRPRPVQADQGRARRHRQRRRPRRRHRRAARAGCTRAASAPRAWSCAPRSRSRSGPRTSAASSATRSPRCAARCPSTSRTR